jgi:hypothetical protein
MEVERNLTYDNLGIRPLQEYQPLDRLRLLRGSDEKCFICVLPAADFLRRHS